MRSLGPAGRSEEEEEEEIEIDKIMVPAKEENKDMNKEERNHTK